MQLLQYTKQNQISDINKHLIDYDADQVYHGIIIGHSVGLGKTVILTFSLAVLFQQKRIRYALICIPKSITQQWIKHCQQWIGQGIKIVEYLGSERNLIDQIGNDTQAIVITTYQTASRDFNEIQLQMLEVNRKTIENEKQRKIKFLMKNQKIKEQEENYQKHQQLIQNLENEISPIDSFSEISDLYQSEVNQQNQNNFQDQNFMDFDRKCAFDIGVFDEFQYAKNSSTDINQNLSKINFFFKIGLTGTPLMNNIKEIYNLVSFLNPQFLGGKQSFISTVAKPIENSRIKDARESVIINGKIYEKLLSMELSKIMIRRTEEQVRNLDIDKTEIIIWFNMSNFQEQVYQNFMTSKSFQAQKTELIKEKVMPFQLISILRKTCENIMKLNKNDASYLDQKIRDKFTGEQKSYIQQIQNSINISEFLKDNYDFQSSQQTTQQIQSNPDDTSQTTSMTVNNTLSQYFNQQTDKPQLIEEKLHELHRKYATKQFLLVEMINEFAKSNRKVLIFAEHTTMLDLIQLELKEANINLLRLDGSITKTNEREALCNKFNQDPKITVFLMTITAGGVGLNLQSASRVIIFSPCWGPAIEEQAIGRAYRIGQKNDVIVYKFVTRNSIEEKMVARQFHKLQVANAITHDKYTKIKAQQSDINSLFVYRNPEFEALPKQIQQKLIQDLEQKIEQEKQQQKQYIDEYDNNINNNYDLAYAAQRNAQVLSKQLEIDDDQLQGYKQIYDSLESQLNKEIPFQQNCPTEAKDLINYMAANFSEYKISGSILRTTKLIVDQQQQEDNSYIDQQVEERFKSILAAEKEIFDAELSELNDIQKVLYRTQMSNMYGYTTIKQLRQLTNGSNQNRENRKKKQKPAEKSQKIIKELDELLSKQNITANANKDVAKAIAGEKIYHRQQQRKQHQNSITSSTSDNDNNIHPFTQFIQPISQEPIHPFEQQIQPLQLDNNNEYNMKLEDLFSDSNDNNNNTDDITIQEQSNSSGISISSTNQEQNKDQQGSTISIS